MLSGRELVENGGRKSSTSLPLRSNKQIIPNGTWLEKKQIENGLDLRRKLLADQRVEKKCMLSQAEWDENTQRAVVTVKKGSCWSYIGHTEHSILYVYPEEVLHLMEMNSLMLKYGGAIVSVQQAYSLLIGKAISLNEYRVYSSLMREGYRLIRHEYNKLFTDALKNEDQNEVEKSVDVTEQPATSMKRITPIIEIDEGTNSDVGDNNKSQDSSMIISDDSSNDCMLVAEVDEDLRTLKKRKATEEPNLLNKRHNSDGQTLNNKFQILDNIVNCFQKKIVHVPAPDEKHIPSEIKLSRRNYFINLSNLTGKVSNNDLESRLTDDLSTNRLRFNNPGIQLNQFYMNNLYTNNSFFFNHIFHKISSQSSVMFSSQNAGMTFGRRHYQHGISYPPPFLSNRQAVPNRNNQQYHNNEQRFQRSKNNAIETVDLSVEVSNSSESEYVKLLAKLNNVITKNKDGKFNVNDKSQLDSIVKEYNSLFNESFIVTKDTTSNNETKELPSTSFDKNNGNTINSAKMQIEEPEVESSQSESNKDDHRSMLFVNWLKNDSWNKPEVSPLKAKRNSQILKLNRAFLNTARKFSFDNKNGILSWKEAREFIEKFNTQNTVSISDDESENTDSDKLNYAIKVKNVKPLIRPQDCLTVHSILDRLQIIGSVDDNVNLKDEEKLKITFDVFKPNVKLIRTVLPSFCLVVRRVDSAVPDSRALKELHSKIPDSIKIFFAVVSVDSVFFLQMENVQLPTMVEDIES